MIKRLNAQAEGESEGGVIQRVLEWMDTWGHDLRKRVTNTLGRSKANEILPGW